MQHLAIRPRTVKPVGIATAAGRRAAAASMVCRPASSSKSSTESPTSVAAGRPSSSASRGFAYRKLPSTPTRPRPSPAACTIVGNGSSPWSTRPDPAADMPPSGRSASASMLSMSASGGAITSARRPNRPPRPATFTVTPVRGNSARRRRRNAWQRAEVPAAFFDVGCGYRPVCPCLRVGPGGAGGSGRDGWRGSGGEQLPSARFPGAFGAGSPRGNPDVQFAGSSRADRYVRTVSGSPSVVEAKSDREANALSRGRSTVTVFCSLTGGLPGPAVAGPMVWSGVSGRGFAGRWRR